MQAVVISAAYLPSQLRALEKMLKQQPFSGIAASLWTDSQQRGTPHVLLALRRPSDGGGDDGGTVPAGAAHYARWQAALVSACAGQPVEPLAPARWQHAVDADRLLYEQLRLFDGACYNLHLNALNARRATRRVLAIRSHMGVAGMRAVVDMASSMGLSVAVLEEAAAQHRLVACADVAGALAAGRQLVLVVSVYSLDDEELAQQLPTEAFTD